jgi:hypothetical protein
MEPTYDDGRPSQSQDEHPPRSEQIPGVRPSELPPTPELPPHGEWTPPSEWSLPSEWALPLFAFGPEGWTG